MDEPGIFFKKINVMQHKQYSSIKITYKEHADGTFLEELVSLYIKQYRK